jgi:hypothetical protein
MNGEGIGYKVLAVATRKMAKAGMMDLAAAEKKARLYDFLATCDKADIYTLFDSSAFNEIVQGYVSAMLDGWPEVEEETREAARDDLRRLFDSMTAEQAATYHAHDTDAQEGTD